MLGPTIKVNTNTFVVKLVTEPNNKFEPTSMWGGYLHVSHSNISTFQNAYRTYLAGYVASSSEGDNVSYVRNISLPP
jgi:hypothetical protein